MKLFWLSFADADLPRGSQFLGACIVEAGSFVEAITEAHRLGINPGGGVQAMELPTSAVVDPSWRGLLMDRATIEAHDKPEIWAKPRAVQ